MVKIERIFLLVVFTIVAACSSEPVKQGPDWIKQPTRLVDNGYIVYIGVAGGSSEERAKFKAEGIALEDLANECSMIPLGTRIEDRYVDKEKYEYTAYVKVGLELQECEAAKKAIQPDNIKKIANVAFTQQLKRFQDLEETGELPDSGEGAEVQPPTQVASAPERQPGWNDSTHFYISRQYVAYQKEIVVLSPPNAYPPDSVQTRQFVGTVQPVSDHIHATEIQQPALRTQPWSHVVDRPALPKPAALAPHVRSGSRAVRPPAAPKEAGGKRAKKAKSGNGRKRRFHEARDKTQ